MTDEETLIGRFMIASLVHMLPAEGGAAPGDESARGADHPSYTAG